MMSLLSWDLLATVGFTGKAASIAVVGPGGRPAGGPKRDPARSPRLADTRAVRGQRSAGDHQGSNHQIERSRSSPLVTTLPGSLSPPGRFHPGLLLLPLIGLAKNLDETLHCFL